MGDLLGVDLGVDFDVDLGVDFGVDLGDAPLMVVGENEGGCGKGRF